MNSIARIETEADQRPIVIVVIDHLQTALVAIELAWIEGISETAASRLLVAERQIAAAAVIVQQ